MALMEPINRPTSIVTYKEKPAVSAEQESSTIPKNSVSLVREVKNVSLPTDGSPSSYTSLVLFQLPQPLQRASSPR